MYIFFRLKNLQNIIVVNYGLFFFWVNDLLGNTWPKLNIEVKNLLTFFFKYFLNAIPSIFVIIENYPLDFFIFLLCEGILLFHIWDTGRDLFLDVRNIRNSTWFVQFFRIFSNIYYNFGFHYLSDIIVGSFITHIILLHISRSTYLWINAFIIGVIVFFNIVYKLKRLMTPMIQKVNKFKLAYRFVLFVLAVAINYRSIVSDSISTEYCIYLSCLIAIIEVALFIISHCAYRSVRFFLIRGLRGFRELSLVDRWLAFFSVLLSIFLIILANRMFPPSSF